MALALRTRLADSFDLTAMVGLAVATVHPLSIVKYNNHSFLYLFFSLNNIKSKILIVIYIINCIINTVTNIKMRSIQ